VCKTAKTIKIIVPQRYEEVQIINGVEYPENSKLEMLIDVDNGMAFGWKVATHIDWKICDEGIYQLLDEDENLLDEIYEDYIPDIIPNEFGDYLDLKINKDGFIERWKRGVEVSSFG
jgi:hypothetical protein